MARSLAPCLSNEQILSFKSAFDYYDKDKDNILNRDEFVQALRLVGIAPTPEELAGMLADIPEEDIKLADFIFVIYYFLRGSETREELTKAFAIFDTDNDGKLPVDLTAKILRSLKHPVPELEITELLARLDRDGTNFIDYAQMIAELRPE